MQNNPNARIITNGSVGKRLAELGLQHEIVSDRQQIKLGKVLVEGHGKKHAVIYPTLPAVENTGYFIAGKLFYPGDAFTNPHKKVGILALPVAGPWMKLSEAIDYAREINPTAAFPVHDGMIDKAYLRASIVMHKLPSTILPQFGIKFVIPEEGKAMEF